MSAALAIESRVPTPFREPMFSTYHITNMSVYIDTYICIYIYIYIYIEMPWILTELWPWTRLLALRTGEKVRAPLLIIHHTRHIIAPILALTMHDSFPKCIRCNGKPPSMRNHHRYKKRYRCETIIDSKPSSMRNDHRCKLGFVRITFAESMFYAMRV